MALLIGFCPCSRLSSGFFSNERGVLLSEGKLPRRRISTPCLNITAESHSGRLSTQRTLVAPMERKEKKCSSGSEMLGFQRRQIFMGGLLAALSLPSLENPAYSMSSGSSNLTSVAAVTTAEQVDEINAYSYVYPVGLDQQTSTVRWVESRKPERYSSAAPLAPDARQRIVSERLNLQNNLVVSVSVGPPNLTFLKTNETSAWGAEDVCRSVLADKSTARMTTGQRVSEVSILDTKTEEKDGVRYWYYEYIVQKSPTIKERGMDVNRHSLAVTAEREGYLYSLNASTSGKNWSRFSPMLKESVLSFRLLPPTSEFVPPYKDPWRFW